MVHPPPLFFPPTRLFLLFIRPLSTPPKCHASAFPPSLLVEVGQNGQQLVPWSTSRLSYRLLCPIAVIILIRRCACCLARVCTHVPGIYHTTAVRAAARIAYTKIQHPTYPNPCWYIPVYGNNTAVLLTEAFLVPGSISSP